MALGESLGPVFATGAAAAPVVVSRWKRRGKGRSPRPISSSWAAAATGAWADVAAGPGATAAVAATATAAIPGAAGSATLACVNVAVAAGAAELEEAWDRKEPPTDLQLLNLLASLKSAGPKPWPPHVHKAKVHSALPADLFKRHQPHAPGTGHGKDDTCYLYDHAPPIKSISKKGVQKRDRKVVGGGIWHPEKKCEPIHGADGSVLGNKRRFSYQSSNGSVPPTGWILFEVSLSPEKQAQDSGDQMVLYTLHKSNRKHPKTSTAVSSAGAVELARHEEEKGDGSAGADERLCSPGPGHGEDMSSPAQVQMPALAISPTSKSGSRPSPEAAAPTGNGKSVVDAEETPHRDKASTGLTFGTSSAPSAEWIKEVANISTKLLMATEKAVSCDIQMAPEISEFVNGILRMIEELGLDRSIVTGSLEKLEIIRKYLVMAEYLTPETRALLVSLGADMTDMIFSTYINENAKKAQQAVNVLKEIGANVEMIEQSWASKAKHNVRLNHSVLHEAAVFLSKAEGAENQRPCPVNSSAESCSSCLKRKAEHDHPEAPASVRQGMADKDGQQLTEDERFLLFDNDMAAGASHSVQQALAYANILNVDGNVVQAEQQGLAEAAVGGDRLGTEEEMTETLQAECLSPGGFPDLSMGDMSPPAPGFAWHESGSHVAAEGWSPGELLNMSSPAPAPAFALCVSGLHPAADCQNPHCGLESVDFDDWALGQ